MARQTSEFVKAFGKAFEVFKVIAHAVFDLGGNDEHIARLLTDDKLVRQIAELIVGKKDQADEKKFSCQIHAADLIPEGWLVVEDVELSNLDITKLEFKSFLERGEERITGEKMRERAVELKGNLGLSDAKYLLAHQNEIPKELRGKYIVLPGTLLRYPDGFLRVPYLRWDGGRWVLDFDWLDGDWRGRDRLAVSK